MSEASVKISGGLTAVSGGGTLISFMTSALPVLQFISVCVGILSGIAGIAWIAVQYYRSKNDE
ncbi:MAG TPA: hypothetical protein VFA39_15570 [Steroidobacteraceae bacterium]|nr:hypothetical protein [Steroidobacteraceae bacterium]